MFFYCGIVDRMLLLWIICRLEEQGAEPVRLNKGFCRNFEDTAALHKWKLLFVAELCLCHFLWGEWAIHMTWHGGVLVKRTIFLVFAERW